MNANSILEAIAFYFIRDDILLWSNNFNFLQILKIRKRIVS